MVMNVGDIQKGMDVYGSDGQKVGKVHDTFPAGATAADQGQGPSGGGPSGGGPGTLGDETRVSTDTGTGGGPGTFGDETRSYSDTGVSGGPGTLGDETRVDDEYAATGVEDAGAGTAGVAAPGPESTMAVGEPGIVAEEVVAVEAVAGGPAPDVGLSASTGSGYFEVDHGGFLGIGTEHLYIPDSAVQSVQPGESVTLNCAADECIRLYNRKPAGLA